MLSQEPAETRQSNHVSERGSEDVMECVAATVSLVPASIMSAAAPEWTTEVWTSAPGAAVHPFCPSSGPGETRGSSNGSEKSVSGAKSAASGSRPHAISSASETPSPSVSARSGFVPWTSSSNASESPSPSVSRVASETRKSERV